MSFPNIDAERRTNDSFRNRADNLHHKEASPFEKLDIDMVFQFPSSDPLHLFDLGLMRCCMFRWVFGAKGYNRKLNKNEINKASKLLEGCRMYMPAEIQRSVRNLDCLRKWKGLEYRNILLYVGIVVFSQILIESEYNHFLILCCAVRICASKTNKNFIPIATKMFQTYIKQYVSLYGQHSVGSNVHLLTHVTEDMQNNKIDNIMKISTYKYENTLGHLKQQVKHGHLPLEQVSRRIIEKYQLRNKIESINLFETQKSKPQVFFPTQRSSMTIFKKIQVNPEVMLSSKNVADCWFYTETDEIVRMEYATKKNGESKIAGRSVLNKNAFFLNPLNSTKLKIFSSDRRLNSEIRIFELNSIVAKMICLPHEENFVFVPLLHTLDILSKDNAL